MVYKLLWAFFAIYQLVAIPQKIIVGLSADYPPFEFKQGEETVGFDVDLAKEIASQLDCTIEIKDMAFGALFNALNTGEIDMILSSVGASEERSKNFDFSIPYFFDKLSILHKSDVTINTEKLDHKSIACQLGTSGMQAWLKTNAPNAKQVLMDAMTQMAEAVKAGHVDGALMDTMQAKEFMKNSKNLTYTVVGANSSGVSVAMKKGSPFLEKVNLVIKQMQENGKLKTIEDKWLNDSKKSTKHNLHGDFIFISKGILTTIMYSFFSICLGGILGILLAISRQMHYGTWIITAIISVLRGTPILLQLSFVYFAVPMLTGIKLSVFASGILTFGINSSAYVAEIIRSGLQSLPKGQFEVCQTLRIPKFYAWKDIILPQVLRNVFPSLVNEIVSLTKETALISILGEMDIMRRAQFLAAETYNYFEPMCLAGIIYYLLVKTIEFIGKQIEKRWYHA